MKKLLLLFILPLLAFKSPTQDVSIVGKWTGEDKNEIGTIIFYDEGYAAFEINGEIIGGKNFEKDGEKGEITYTIDTTKSPMEINLIMKNFTRKDEKTLLCIAEFIDDDTLNFAMSFTDQRPVDFSGANTINLKRAE